jgi:hypothetical protein
MSATKQDLWVPPRRKKVYYRSNHIEHDGWLIGLGYHNVYVQWERHSINVARFLTSRSISGRLIWEIP